MITTRPRARAGFTFWEIAAVVTLLLVIAAIMFPVFQKVRRTDHHGSCQSNMKQMGQAYNQYLQDSDNVFPPGVDAAGRGWAGKLYPFIKSARAYHCPQDAQSGPYISYAQNQNLSGQPLTVLAGPVYTVELYEFTTLSCDPSTPETVSATGLAAPQDSTRHDPQTFTLNFLVTDGHVTHLTPIQVSSGSGALPTRKITRNQPARLTFSVK